MKPIVLTIIILLINLSCSSIVGHKYERHLLGDDQLEDSLRTVVSDTELNAKYATKRIQKMFKQVRKVREKCNKYIFLMKNYVAFYQSKKEQTDQINIANSISSDIMANQPLTEQPVTNPALSEQPVQGVSRRILKIEPGNFKGLDRGDFGNIETHEMNFANLDDSKE